ncbi:histone methyltransferase set1 [Elasticomyces elasticus]|nr:histone methyltransferase set1 [Elasticomyces elasticus]
MSPRPYGEDTTRSGLGVAQVSPASDGPRHTDAGDVLNGIGSASSLASNASSIFSAPSSRHLGASSLTPLTNTDSSPPSKTADPRLNKKPYGSMSASNGLLVGATTALPPRHSRNLTPEPSPPQDRPSLRPPQGEAKGYRAVYDPELDGKLSKDQKKKVKVRTKQFGAEHYEPDPPPDPRLAIPGYAAGTYHRKNPASKGKVRIAPYVVTPYAFDQQLSVGPGPPKNVCITGFDPFTPESQIRATFGSWGDIAEVQNQTDPSTGSFLGICLIKYKDSRPLRGIAIPAHAAAKKAEQEFNGQRLGLKVVRVERDREGRRCRRHVESTLKRATEARDKDRSMSIAPPPVPQSPSGDTPAPPPNAPKGPSQRSARPPPEGPRAQLNPKATISSLVESEPVLSKIKRKPYLFLAHEIVPVLPTTIPHLKKRLKNYDWREVRLDRTGYYVVFEDSKRGEDETVRTWNECNEQPLFTYLMHFECHQYGNPNYERSPSPERVQVERRKREELERLQKEEEEDIKLENEQRSANLDPVRGAVEQLRTDLREKIMTDIKAKIAMPTFYDYLDPAQHIEKRRKLGISDPRDTENKLPALLFNKADELSPGTPNSRFGHSGSSRKPLSRYDMNAQRLRKSISNAGTNVFADERRKRPPRRPVASRPLQFRLQQMYKDEEDDSDDERRTSITRDTEDQESRPLSRASTSTPFESEATDTPRKRRKLAHKHDDSDAEDEPETFTALQKGLVGHLLRKDPEDMATRELELIVNTLPRTSEFQKRARSELFIRQRSKYDDELFQIKSETVTDDTALPSTESVLDGRSDGADTPGSRDLSVKPSQDKSKRKKKSKKRTFEEREILKVQARATIARLQPPDIDTVSQTEESEAALREGEEATEDETNVKVSWRATEGKPRRTVDDEGLVVLDVDGWQHAVKDDEDMRILKKAVGAELGADLGDVRLWAWKQKEIKALNNGGLHGMVESVAKVEGYYVPNPSGSARTEGVKKIFESEKSKFLPHRIKVQKAREERERQAEHDPAVVAETATIAAAAKVESTATSRSNRANNRRLVNDINAHKQTLSIGAEGDAIRFNQLKKRKKLVKFDRSAIHGWGLYAMENIAHGDLIIEYVGEKVRQKVADMREIRYTKQGIGSSYLFRMFDDEIVDATKKGGIARFINHSCSPNCTARIIRVDGTRRIVIYALKDVGKNEELTYDYKFEREYGSTDRIPCLCGSVNCKGFLN